MQKLFLIIALSIASAIPLAAQMKPATQTSEQAVLQLTRDWLAAEERHDRPTLQRIIADDFEGTAPMGNTVFKDDVLPIEGSQRGLAITTSEIKARVFGETAVVTARGVQKADEKREVRFTVVFVKRQGEWKMVAGHLSAVPS
ncbi:MAG TPA: nuclear transport factor 2 family protein [Pyrinomonadaceae bacterium]|nr:nuclear transport factor 2 family protein [Pyrinomonadaceae bacterium]